MQTTVVDAEAMRNLGQKIASVLRAGDVVVLDGPLGAGKTTFTQGLAQGLNVSGVVTSPTFVVARAHKPLADGPALVHVDAYRLTGAGDIDDLDFEQHGPHVLVMEWGGPFVQFVTDDWLHIRIDRDDVQLDSDDPAGGTRQIDIEPHGPRWSEVNLVQVIA
jgi:tRNA threonylcarbamoyl adenosine modification protein YjeE